MRRVAGPVLRGEVANAQGVEARPACELQHWQDSGQPGDDDDGGIVSDDRGQSAVGRVLLAVNMDVRARKQRSVVAALTARPALFLQWWPRFRRDLRRAATIRNVKVLGGYNTARAVASCRVLRGVVAWIYVLMLLNP